MKKQIFNQRINLFIFIVMFFVYCGHGIVYAGLEFAEGGSTIREIAENTPSNKNIGDPLRYSVSGVSSCPRYRLHGADADSFNLKRFGNRLQLKTKSALDYESNETYEVKVTVSTRCSRDTITVTINVLNVNETPVFSDANVEGNTMHRVIPENTVPGIKVGSPISATDPDGSEEVLTYNLKGNDANMFAIDRNTGQLMTKEPLDYEAFDSDPRSYSVVVEVSDASVTSKTDVTIDVEPVNEFAPMFIEGENTTRVIASTDETGVNIGEPVLAMDMDAGETLEYSLCDAGTGAFEIDSSTGQLRNTSELDERTKPKHIVIVIVSDGTFIDSIIVTIDVQRCPE